MKEFLASKLWVGNAMEARDPAPLFDAEIKAIVDIAYEEKPAALPRQLIYCRIPLSDSGGNEPATLKLALDITVRLIEAGHKTLIACSAGLSRSPTIAAFAIATFSKQKPDTIINELASQFALDIHPIFWQDVATVFETHYSP